MKIAIASSSILAIPTISALEKAGHSIVGLITNPDKASGRGRALAPNELAGTFAEGSVPIYKPASHLELQEVVKKLAPDIAITIAYGRLIRPEVLALPKHGWLNLHFSLLPAYRGAAPVQRAILDGATETGITIFRLDPGMDTGDIFLSKSYPIAATDTSGELLSRLADEGAQAVAETLSLVQSGAVPKPQSEVGVSVAPKISVEEARIDWLSGCARIDRLIRAMTPRPGAWTTLNGLRYVISKSAISEERLRSGLIFKSGDRLLVGTGDGAIEIISLQPSGKRLMSAAEWLRGARLDSDSSFE